MDLTSLPFDADAMLAGLRPWIECESPTWNADAVNRVLALVCRDAADAGAVIDHIPGHLGFGDCALATFPHARRSTPGILVMGHLDTVHPLGTLDALPWRRDATRCYGPGILDMKGGVFIALDAIRQLANAGVTPRLPVSLLLTSDEEAGSPSTRELIEAQARRHKYVLVPEMARPNGGVVTGRYAIARFHLEARGTPSHAGLRLSDGRSAIKEMARKVIDIEAMTCETRTFSVGVVHGGRWVNCVSSLCTGEALTMARTQADLDAAVEAMLSLRSATPGVDFSVTRSVTRPLWEPDGATLALYESARSLAASLGFELPHQSDGGGSDGNFTGALGIPTLDGLGVAGTGFHTLNEHIEIDSLVRRGRLLAGLLATLD